MTLTVAYTQTLGGRVFDIAFETGPGVTALFGPSGAGKTSIVHAVAGLSRPDAGRIVVGGRVLFDGAARVSVPVHQRRVGCVFQEARLFPHMTVRQNLTYGGSADFDDIVSLLGLEALLDRRPAGLSGGESQRVALGRALMSAPEILLLDEPLAALDAPRKAEILPYLERIRDAARLPVLYVSHDLSEITRLASHLVLIEDGHVRHAGPIAAILSDPRHSRYFGVRNAGALIEGTVVGYDAEDALSTIRFAGGELTLPDWISPPDASVRVRVAAQDVILARQAPPDLSARNCLPARVTDLHQGGGPGMMVGLSLGQTRLLARITRRAGREMGLAVGDQVWAIFKTTAVSGRNVSAGGFESEN